MKIYLLTMLLPSQTDPPVSVASGSHMSSLFSLMAELLTSLPRENARLPSNPNIWNQKNSNNS